MEQAKCTISCKKLSKNEFNHFLNGGKDALRLCLQISSTRKNEERMNGAAVQERRWQPTLRPSYFKIVQFRFITR